MKEPRKTDLRQISRIIMGLEPLAETYERDGTELFKACSELLAFYRALEKRLLADPRRELKLRDIYRRTFTGTFMGDRRALLKVAADHEARDRPKSR